MVGFRFIQATKADKFQQLCIDTFTEIEAFAGYLFVDKQFTTTRKESTNDVVYCLLVHFTYTPVQPSP